jgi:hypothetical protein
VILRSTDIAAALRDRRSRLAPRRAQRGFFTLPGGMGASKPQGGGPPPSTTTWSPTDKTGQWATTLGDLRATWTGAGLGSIRATAGCGTTLNVVWATSWNSFVASVFYAGVTSASQAIGSIGSPYLLIQTDGTTLQAGGTGSGASIGSMSPGEITMFAMKGATGEIWVGKGGTWSGDPGAGTGAAYTFSSITDYKPLLQSFNNAEIDLLVGADNPYALPSGFASL